MKILPIEIFYSIYVPNHIPHVPSFMSEHKIYAAYNVHTQQQHHFYDYLEHELPTVQVFASALDLFA